MADVVDKETRSRMMSGIRGKNTKPEIYIRKGLHALGFRYRLHANDVPGKPDILLPRYHAIINVHGCFWHWHGCRYCKPPSENADFWKNKITRNQFRDKKKLKQQIGAGWRCLVVWECAVRKSQKSRSLLNVVALAADWLSSNSRFAVIDEKGLKEKVFEG